MSRNPRFWKDFWQLHVPLVVVLAIVAYATYVEVGRAMEGVTRAIVYSIQWPIIGVFAVIVWNRYRKHGNLTKSIANRWRQRIERLNREAEQREQVTLDDDRLAWEAHVAELQRLDPPGRPPEKG